MTEDSERMMLLLKELALLKERESEHSAHSGGVERSAVARRRKEITREMKRLAQARKNKLEK